MNTHLVLSVIFFFGTSTLAQDLGDHSPSSCNPKSSSPYGTLDQLDSSLSRALGGVQTSNLCGPVCAANVIAKLRKRIGAPKPVLEDAVRLTMLVASANPELLTQGTRTTELKTAIILSLLEEGIPVTAEILRVGASTSDLNAATDPDSAVIVLLQPDSGNYGHYVHLTGTGTKPSEFYLGQNALVGSPVEITPGFDRESKPELRIRALGPTQTTDQFGIRFILKIKLLPQPT